MSINLDLPLTCNGQPVEVLTGWSGLPWSDYAFVKCAYNTHVMDHTGRIFDLRSTDCQATNTAPAPNLVESMYRIAHEQARPKWNGAGNHAADLTDAEIVDVRK